MKKLIIGKNDAGQRLDKFITKAVKGLPQSLMYKYIRTKKIKLNGSRAGINTILTEGDEVLLYIKESFFSSPEKDDSAIKNLIPKLEVLYEDSNILLINKRPGVLVHEDANGKDNTLLMHLWAYLYRSGEYNPDDEMSFSPSFCNRIDRNTGGIVIAAKNAKALREMNDHIRSGDVHKYYLCAVHGKMPKDADIITAYLKKDEITNTVNVSDSPLNGYKIIKTGYRVLSFSDNISLLEIELFTGRTHQIRAHMAHLGHPLLGDGKYGINREDKRKGYKYQALYSYKLIFDFNEKGECLNYLSGRVFSLDANSIWFVKDFE